MSNEIVTVQDTAPARSYVRAFDNGYVRAGEKDETATALRTETSKHDMDSFLDFYKIKPSASGYITLYKVINKETNCDFYSGKIEYKGLVKCPDWNGNVNIKCGKGLHSSATPEEASRYKNGKIIKCKVNIKDIAIYPYDISKVRKKNNNIIKKGREK